MELGVLLVGVMLRLLDWLAAPLGWLRARRRRAAPPPRGPLLRRSAARLARDVRAGQRTSEEIVSAFIERVKEVDPYLNAVVEERFSAALEDARQVDRMIREADSEAALEALFRDKPLLGVPFTVKESCSLGGLSNSVGCVENAGSRAPADSVVVALVRKAGAIPLLVSNTPELCLGWETTNLLRGATNNPYCLDRTPGGSSGGEAALLACGASAFSVASDIAGSIRLPAAFCGVFGHKPTPGIISIDSHVPTLTDPQFPRFLTFGPMARAAEDLPLLLGVMAGENSHKLRLHDPVDLNTLKVLYMTAASRSVGLIPVQRCVSDAILAAVRYLRDCGATVSEEKFEELEDSVDISISLFFSMRDIPNMLQDPADPKRSRSLALELCRAALGAAARSLQALCFALIHRTRLFIPARRAAVYRARAHQLKDRMTSVLGESGVLIYPVFHEPAHLHNMVFLKASGVMYTMVFNVLGMPAAAVPMGRHRGLPVALQVIAAPHQDRLCLAVARALEAGFGGWSPPA